MLNISPFKMPAPTLCSLTWIRLSMSKNLVRPLKLWICAIWRQVTREKEQRLSLFFDVLTPVQLDQELLMKLHKLLSKMWGCSPGLIETGWIMHTVGFFLSVFFFFCVVTFEGQHVALESGCTCTCRGICLLLSGYIMNAIGRFWGQALCCPGGPGIGDERSINIANGYVYMFSTLSLSLSLSLSLCLFVFVCVCLCSCYNHLCIKSWNHPKNLAPLS